MVYMSIFKQKWLRPELVFLLVLLAIGFVYNYHEIAFLKPVGIHQWRNSVSAAFPVNFYHGGSFFTTQTNALLSDNMSSDITVVEFPLVYYLISLLYRVFGVHVFWFRMFQVFIGFVGLVYLFKASNYFTKNWFYAGIIPLIIFTSPIYSFYLNNFIPDAVALSLTFAGFYFFMKYTEERRLGPWLFAMLFFALAGLTKTSSLLPYLGLGTVAFIDLLQVRRKPLEHSLFTFNYKYILSFLLVLVMIFAWYLYAKIYSEAHSGSVSAVEIRPIWDLDGETITATLKSMKNWYRKGDYHAQYFLIFTAFALLFTLVMAKKTNRFLYTLNVLVFAGAISFTLLFFRSMRNHDYYQINNLFLFVTIYLALFSILSTTWPKVYHSIWMKLGISAVMILLVWNCSQRISFRYSERDMHFNSSSKTLAMYDIEDYLDEIGLDRSKKVYITPDRSINISLYLCNRKGLTDYSSFWRLSLEERLEKMKEHDINYVILGDREHYKDVENLDQILGQKIGQIGETEIFRLE
jgi:hypothetical protein